jgi:hypothetical protein
MPQKADPWPNMTPLYITRHSFNAARMGVQCAAGSSGLQHDKVSKVLLRGEGKGGGPPRAHIVLRGGDGGGGGDAQARTARI